MPTEAEIIQELRTLFKKGATPSRMVRYVVQRFPDQQVSIWTICEYLEKAFCIPMVRLIRPGVDLSSDLRLCAAINRNLIPEIISLQADWDKSDDPDFLSDCWFDGLNSTTPHEAKALASVHRNYDVSEATWESLSESEKESLRLQTASTHTLVENVKILATLAERLQQQVEELEQRLASLQPEESPVTS